MSKPHTTIDFWIHIIKFSYIEDIMNYKVICKKLYNYINTTFIWNLMLKRDFSISNKNYQYSDKKIQKTPKNLYLNFFEKRKEFYHIFFRDNTITYDLLLNSGLLFDKYDYDMYIIFRISEHILSYKKSYKLLTNIRNYNKNISIEERYINYVRKRLKYLECKLDILNDFMENKECEKVILKYFHEWDTLLSKYINISSKNKNIKKLLGANYKF